MHEKHSQQRHLSEGCLLCFKCNCFLGICHRCSKTVPLLKEVRYAPPQIDAYHIVVALNLFVWQTEDVWHEFIKSTEMPWAEGIFTEKSSSRATSWSPPAWKWREFLPKKVPVVFSDMSIHELLASKQLVDVGCIVVQMVSMETPSGPLRFYFNSTSSLGMMLRATWQNDQKHLPNAKP